MFYITTFLCFAFTLTAYPVSGARILGVFPFPSISHQVVFQPIWKELSLRGHEVTVLVPNPLNDKTLTNLTEIDTGYTYDLMNKKFKLQEMVSKDKHLLQLLDDFYVLENAIVNASISHPTFMEILQDKEQHFDLILIEHFTTSLLGLSGRFRAPIILVSSLGTMAPQHIALGNPVNPLLYPEMLLEVGKKTTIWGRLKVVSDFVLYRLHYYFRALPRQDEFMRKLFGENIPYLGELEKNISLMLLNVNPILHYVRPNVPAVIEMHGLIHVKGNKSLPMELQKILDEAKEGVIYLSLGSNVKSVHIPEKLQKRIKQALSELPYKVLWKWESDFMPEKPDNVVTRKWLPQQDLLAHPNIKAFITQGGLQSTQEAISRGVPLIGMPFFGDQPQNVQKLIELGVGVGVDPATVTKDEFKNAIIEVAENIKYRKRVEEVRDLINDIPMNGLEKAVYWCEYVIRHKGAKHLRSPTIDVPWYQYMFVDIVLLLTSIMTALVFVVYKCVGFFKTSRKTANKLKDS